MWHPVEVIDARRPGQRRSETAEELRLRVVAVDDPDPQPADEPHRLRHGLPAAPHVAHPARIDDVDLGAGLLEVADERTTGETEDDGHESRAVQTPHDVQEHRLEAAPLSGRHDLQHPDRAVGGSSLGRQPHGLPSIVTAAAWPAWS